MSSTTPDLEGDDVRLRQPREGDIDARFEMGANVDIAVMFGLSRDDVSPLTRAAAEKWVQNFDQNPHAWIIEAEGRLIGEIRLDRVDLRDRRASMAIGIYDKALLGRGFGSAAIKLVLGHAFGAMQLHRISVRVLAYNHRAIRAYEKCGFVLEGCERETAFVDGHWHDDIMMGVLAHEFASQEP